MKCFIFSLILLLSAGAKAVVHHALDIQVLPALKTLKVADQLTFSRPLDHGRFSLHKNLQLMGLPGDLQIQEIPGAAPVGALYRVYEWHSPAVRPSLSLQYQGVIYEAVVNDESSGLISNEGAVLMEASYWLPVMDEALTYEIRSSQLPTGWLVASPLAQRKPQEDVYFIAGPFTVWTLPGAVELKVYLRSEEPQLAQTFLNLLPGYLDHYQKEIGPYPYSSFAVVENFYETGLGMPGFTLLGPSVLRLPYILNSSLPHELLHNWWGNGVYVDYARGNWSEGLTTYMADFWQQDLVGHGREYRQTLLANYQDYAREGQDFPLRQFKGRHSLSTQAVGYGKGMMFFHMLKKLLPEGVFAQALKDFYQTYQHQSVSFEEIQKSFEKTSGVNLQSYFSQWLDRRGAPGLEIVNASGSSLTLAQQAPVAYELKVPLRWTFADGSHRDEAVMLTKAQQSFQFAFSKKVSRLEVDPEMDLFRALDPRERPVSLSQAFGAKEAWLVSSAATAVQAAYVQTWKDSLGVELKTAGEDLLTHLPSQGVVILLGDAPAYEKWMTSLLRGQDFAVSSAAIHLLGQNYLRAQNSTVVVASESARPDLVFVWIRGGLQEKLAPRILHYGKFGVLVFTDQANILKSSWPVLDSPLKRDFPYGAFIRRQKTKKCKTCGLRSCARPGPETASCSCGWRCTLPLVCY